MSKKNIVEDAADKLIGKVKIIKKELKIFPKPICRISIDKLTTKMLKGKINYIQPIGWEALEKELIKLNNKNDSVIYVIKVKNFDTSEEKGNEYDNFKSRNKKQNMSRRIEPHWDNKQKNKFQCLYVGSSHDIKNRIKQHLGIRIDGKRSTYALYLDSWLSKFIINKEYIITIDIYSFKKNKKINKNIKNYLQIIEDLMWEAFEPLFGRQGAK